MAKRSMCGIEQCGRPLGCRGLCGTHYKNLKKTGVAERPCPTCGVDMVVIGVAAAYCSAECRPKCRIEWCDNVTTGKRDVCSPHYAAIAKRGRDPLYGLQRDKHCVSCGSRDWHDNGLRKYCSRACARVWGRSGGEVVREVECVSCGATTPVFRTGESRLRKVRADRTRCGSCARERNAMTVAELRERDGGDCSVCGRIVDFSCKFPHPDSPSVDHVVPLSRGGANAPDNLALACLGCNRKKWHSAPVSTGHAA